MALPQFISSATLQAEVAVTGSWATYVDFVVAGLQVSRSHANALYYVQAYVGEANVPADIRRLRKSSHQVMRRMGQPVIVKHMFNAQDAQLGLAKPSPASADAYGQQVRNRDPYSYGTGYCSAETSPNEWISPTGQLVTSVTDPGTGYIPAPMYRGYGPGFLTYLIEPDVALDLFKLSPAGALIKSQSQTVVGPWFPEINDNDLIINVELDPAGYVAETHERYEAKRTSPVTIRGLDRRGGREYSADHGNRHTINQNFEMALLPSTSTLYSVETDR